MSATRGLSLEDTTSLKQAFDICDTTQSGSIPKSELQRFLKRDSPLFKMLSAIDEENITFEQVASMSSRKVNPDDKEDVARLFKMFDSTGNGEISLYDLKRVYQGLGMELDDKALADIIQQCDFDDDSRLTFEDFHRLLLARKHN